MALDPVCAMTVTPEKAAGTSVYKGETVYFCSPACKRRFDEDPEKFMAPGAKEVGAKRPAHELAKDPICGMVVEKDKSLKKEIGGRMYYFCSNGCVSTFVAPEEELRRMKRRVSIALAGVLALGIHIRGGSGLDFLAVVLLVAALGLGIMVSGGGIDSELHLWAAIFAVAASTFTQIRNLLAEAR